jgi:WD40 repeat protein
MGTKNHVLGALTSLLVLSLFGCVQTNQIESPIIITPTAPINETPIDTPTPTPTPILTPSPSPAPAYSYLPIISETNVTEVVKFDNFDGSVSSLAISPNGKYLAATFNNGAGIIWDISAVKGWREWRDVPRDIFLAQGAVSFSSDSSILATGGTLLELPSKKIIQELPGTVTFSPIGKTLASADWSTISLWNLDGNQWALDYNQDSQGTASVVFSPDGSLLGEALDWGSGEGVNVWRVSDHTLLYSFEPPEHGHPAHFNFFAYAFLAFSPDNHFIATGTRDQPVVRIWSLQTGELVNDLNTVVETNENVYYVPDVVCVSFSQDSKVIAIAGDDTIIFKKIPDGEYIGMLKINKYSSSPASYIRACAASNDGKLLFVGDSRGEVSIWGVPAPAP